MSASTKNYSADIQSVADVIKNAERVVMGIGSGMTSAGGLSYSDPELAKKWYPEYYTQGKSSISEIMGDFWPTTLHEKNAPAFWRFWAKHIFHIRYEPSALQPYCDLYDLVKDKDYFICSTNVDGQLEKAGFEKNTIFAPQGDYALFQCERPCSQDAYDNKTMVEEMIKHMPSPLEIKKEDIPRCPRCGSLLVPNLRCDNRFVEKSHLINAKRYETFLNDSLDKELVLLELGVGFNTPVIIRYPFEQLTRMLSSVTLVRINDMAASVPIEIEGRTISVQADLLTAMRDICSVAGTACGL
jgi:NAD-dependent SIR2 family protein deacetylase